MPAASTVFLERFYENLIFHGTNGLKNRFCHILWQANAAPKSAISKCKNCTLDEAAVLELLSENPKETQKMPAVEIGKSERTVKSITKALQEKRLLARKNGKRNSVRKVQK